MPSYADRKAAALAALPTLVAQVFNDAQKPNSNQRKHAIALRKIQEQCTLNAPLAETGGQQDIDPEGELAFNRAVIQCINKILQIRKKEPHADRVTRFIANFLQYTLQLDSKQEPEEERTGDEEGQEEEEPKETVSSHFAEYLLRHLLLGLTAKNKSVRLRCCQIIALSINTLGEIDEELYQELRRALFDRIKDKEISVRMQAATALARLQDADDEVDEKDGKTITQKLLTLLQHDPSPEVRRVVLFNLDKTQQTIPYIIERARDVDAISRRVVFLKPMAEIEDFRILTVQQRHNLLKWGLNDRDPLVRKAATKLISTHWIRHADNNLLEFLERMDVVEGGAAEDILMAFFGARMDIVSSIKFEDQFWDNLSPESAFMAKVFLKFLKSKHLDEKLDSILPEVTRHAFYIETYNDLWHQAPKETEGDYEFVVGQLLDIAKYLDYADEVGRRKMFVLLRQILIAPDIPDYHLICTVELFKIISLDERDFTRTMIEIISDIREREELEEGQDIDDNASYKRTKLSDGSFVKTEDAEGEQAKGLHNMLSRLKCLTICRHMLERSEESLQDNSSLYGILNEIIVPAVQSKETVLREEGLHCMGLCCSLDRSLGLHNISLFVQCLRNGHEELQQKGLMILFDLMMNYGFTTVQSKFDNPAELTEIFELCLDHDSPVIQSIAVEGLAKLMLARLYRDEDVLKLMVMLYFFPSTVDNLKIQQCLSYFFPVYCYSSPENQACLAKISVSALQELCETYTDLEQDEEMVSPSQISDMLADWTDPRKIATTKLSEVEKQKIDMAIQADMTLEILKAVYRNTGVTRKTMCHMLLKMYIAEAGDERLDKMLLLTEHIEKERPIKEATVRNSFNRFVKSISKYLSRADGHGSSVDGSVEPEAEADEEDTATVATAATGTTNE